MRNSWVNPEVSQIFPIISAAALRRCLTSVYCIKSGAVDSSQASSAGASLFFFFFAKRRPPSCLLSAVKGVLRCLPLALGLGGVGPARGGVCLAASSSVM